MTDAFFHARVRAPVHPLRTCGLPLAKSLFLGLMATWLTSVLLQPQPARAQNFQDPAPLEVALAAAEGHRERPSAATGGTYRGEVLDPSPWSAAGIGAPVRNQPGSGPIEPTLASLLRGTPPVPAPGPNAAPVPVGGYIDAGMIAQLEKSIARGNRVYSITSRGGELMVAREMAAALNRSGSTLVAQGQCHSACAYLWLATERRQVGPSADLALHASYNAEGVTPHGEQWLREIGRADLAHWAVSRDFHHLSIDELGL
jgi:membrane-bound ClpP family serine protease